MARRVSYGGESETNYSGPASIDVPVYSFSKGLITDVSPLGYPPDSALEMENFELLVDGSVRRRRACTYEDGEVPYALTGDEQIIENDKFNWINWHTSFGNDYIAVRIGNFIHLYDDEVALSAAKSAFTVDMQQFASEGTGHGNVTGDTVQMCVLNGDLVVSSRQTDTFYIRDKEDTIFVAPIYPIIRQFTDRKDGINMTYKPLNENGEYTSDHRYNLRNRGWTDIEYSNVYGNSDGIFKYIGESHTTNALITAPSKNMIPHRGYVPQGGATITHYYFDMRKMRSQDFGENSAPIGHIKHYVYKNHTAYALSQERKSYTAATAVTDRESYNNFRIRSWTQTTPFTGSLISTTITFTVGRDITRGGVANGWPIAGLPYAQRVQIVGSKFTYTATATGVNVIYEGTYDGDYDLADSLLLSRAAGPPGNSTWEVNYVGPWDFAAFVDQDAQFGMVYLPFTNTHDFSTAALASSPEEYITGGDTTDTSWDSDVWRFECNAAFAGRLWLARCVAQGQPQAAAFFNDKVFFSKIVENVEDYGTFYQINDPTNDILNNLLPSDGGYVEIPGLGLVTKMVPIQDHLWIFSQNGVWELSGSQGFFAADNISIRKLSDVGTASDLDGSNPNAVLSLEDTAIMISPRGMYGISQDKNSGYPTLISLTEGLIQTYWDTLDPGALLSAQLLYDSTLKRVWMLYYEPDDGQTYTGTGYPKNRALIYDMRLKAFYIFTFGVSEDERIIGAVSLQARDRNTPYKQIKFFDVDTTTGFDLRVLDMAPDNAAAAPDNYSDYAQVPVTPFIITAYDSTPKDFERKRQALYITTFMERTETSFDPPTDESYLTMEARWDWTDHTNSGKIDTAHQIYRHLRPYIPADPTDIDTGSPVIVVKSKVRGTGRSLHLKFTGASNRPAHLLGWTVRYKASRRL